MLSFSYMGLSSQAVNRLLHLSNRPAGKAEHSNTLNGFFKVIDKKSRIRETKNLSTDADSRTDTVLERLRDLSIFYLIYKKKKK